MTDTWVDNQGDIWHVGVDGLMHAYETAPFPREYVEKKWGPLEPAPVGACELSVDGWCLTHSTPAGPVYCQEGS